MTLALFSSLFLVTQIASSDATANDRGRDTLAVDNEHHESGWKDLSLEASVGFASGHLTYGLVDNLDPVYTNSASVTWRDFAFSSEIIFDTTAWGERHGGYGDRSWRYQELDFGPEYSHTFESVLPVDLEIGIGYVYAHHPRVTPGFGYENPDTQFINSHVGLPSVLFSPTITFEADVGNERGAMYFRVEGSHKVDIVDTLTVEFGAGLGVGNPLRNSFDADIDRWGIKDIGGTIALHWTPVDWLDITPSVEAYEQVDPALREAARHAIDGEERHSAQFVAGLSLNFIASGASESR